MRTLLVRALVLAIASTAIAVVPSYADQERFFDGRRDLQAAGADLHQVVVRNDTRVVLTFKHQDLRAGYYASVTAYIDTTKRRPGPEFGIGGGIGGDSDWQIWRMRRWQVAGDGPLNCPTDLNVDYRNDTSQFVITRSCLDGAGRVRVSVVASDDDGGRDWAPRFRRFYAWVGR
jgi:hypothetical protein